MTSLLGGVLLFLCVINAEEHPRVRLIHGPVPYAGVVQVLNDGVWHFVCGDLWDFPTANVTCNQLGFQDGALLSLKGFPFGSEVELRNSSKFIVVQCQGLESSLVACPFQEVNTNTCAKGFANVICRNESIDLNDTSVRLTGANVMYAGRVEVRYAGIWGRACSRNWGANETNVVCRQLGYRGAFKGVVTTQRIFGKGEGPAWLQIDCQGDEKSLEDCSKGEWGLEDCSEDINSRTSTNAICMVTESSNETVEVRLLGTTSSAGQVQVRYNGLWGAVNFSGWDFKDARVVCRQLGFIGLAAVFEGAPHSPRQGLVWLTDLNCTGEESSISDCPHPGWGSRAAHASESTTGVQCYTNESAGDFTFRLKGSESSNAGRVEVFVKGDWGKVCDNSWDLKDAGVLCRQLGFSAAVTTLSGSTFGEGTGTGIMDYIRCSGDEDSLAHCPHRRTHSCGIRSVAGVVCSPTDNLAKELNVRLGTTMQGPPNAGRVEVRFAGVWGTVCRSGFEKVDADVVCRQLGFPAAQEVAPVSWSFGHGGGPIWVSHLRCTGNETSIEQCPRGVEWGIVTNCSHSDDVGVICQLPQPNRTQIADDIYVPITIEMNIAQWNLTAFKLAVAKAFTEHCGVASCFAEQSAQSKALEFKSSDVRIPSGFPKVLPGGAHILVNVSVVKPDGEPGRPIPAEHLEQLLLETSRVISKKLGYNIIQVNKTPVTNNNVMTTQKTDSVGGVRRSEMPPTRPKWIIAMAIFLPIVIIIGVAVILHFACDENWKDKETSISEDDNDVRQPLQEIEHKKSNERNGNDSPSPVI